MTRFAQSVHVYDRSVDATVELNLDSAEYSRTVTRAILAHLKVINQGNPVFSTNLPLDALLAPSTKSRKNRGIARPQNEFVLYRKDIQPEIVRTNPTATFSEISKIAGARWKDENPDKKRFFTILSQAGYLAYQELFPGYSYKPRRAYKKKEGRSIETSRGGNNGCVEFVEHGNVN
ncbi:10083_t:CDS:1 [Paraglomus brasilianum]|uniref:10083_t:CDS:1 n=1 Tax=Paraglomus brasilianum TaxID=144538 RepID=A0A9N8Z6K6_9GLOM|nr:10083_t:CDS:1 [Paraglomus brasilianum]